MMFPKDFLSKSHVSSLCKKPGLSHPAFLFNSPYLRPPAHAAPDAWPTSHLIVKARDAIYRYRRKGSSVDGKLSPRGRTKQYDLFRLDAPSPHDNTPQGDTVSDPQTPRRVTEEHACANVLLDDLRENLSAAENQALTFRLMNIPWRQVGELMDQGKEETAHMRRSITGAAQVIWSVSILDRAGSVRVDNADGVGQA